jgi:hypothetical protein
MSVLIPGNVEDIRSRVFGRLTVFAYEGMRIGSNGRRYHYWLCRCSCSSDKLVSVKGELLRSGNTKSCGCQQKAHQKEFGKRNLKHGRSETKEFRAWAKMLARCYNTNDWHYPNWGGRGIRVCKRWKDSFTFFLEDMGEAPSPQHTLERIDNDGSYYPDNCRWAPHAEQARNTRRNCRLSFQGRTMILSDWARELGLPPYILSDRLRRGWSVEEAISRPHSGWGGVRQTKHRIRRQKSHGT